MPRINTRGGQPVIGDMRHLVWITTTREVPDLKTPSTIVERPGVFQCHARIRNLRAEVILNYQSVFGTQNTPTFEVTIRNPPDVAVDLHHWVYRIDPPAMWLKVRSVTDLGNVGRFLVLNCSIDEVNDERIDPATQEPPTKWDEPDAPLRVVDRI